MPVDLKAAQAAKKPVVHLFRGAPPVRSWSKYRSTVAAWTLCGRKTSEITEPATENPASVTCKYCLDLMEPKPYDKPHPPRAITS